jgi:uncharacterized protein
MKILQPFHEGEIAIQEELNERDTALGNGRLYEDRIMAQAHKFLSLQTFLILGHAKSDSIISTSTVFGQPGFVNIKNEGKNIVVDLRSHNNLATDPVLRELKVGDKIGILAIELSTRRRLRINGIVEHSGPAEFTVLVEESYPNCPKYIQKRSITIQESTPSNPAPLSRGSSLTAEQLSVIQNSDTFFVSTYNPKGNADASHRGGIPGFIKISADGSLRIPDYPGNSLYNTFGNLKVNPHAGLLFWDFETHQLIHLWGKADLNFHVNEDTEQTGNTERWWNFRTEAWEQQTIHLPFQFRFEEFSKFNPDPK